VEESGKKKKWRLKLNHDEGEGPRARKERKK